MAPPRQTRLIGLVGGLGPAATVFYYRRLVDLAAGAGVALRLLISHADVRLVLKLAATGDIDALAAYLDSLADGLAAAGAELLALGAVTAHMAAPRLIARPASPWVDLTELVQAEIRRRALDRVVLFGTRAVMESQLFGTVRQAVSPPDANLTTQAHDLYVSIVGAGGVGREHSGAPRIAQAMLDSATAQAVVLAGTELALFPEETWRSLPILNCAEIHVRSIFDRALEA